MNLNAMDFEIFVNVGFSLFGAIILFETHKKTFKIAIFQAIKAETPALG